MRTLSTYCRAPGSSLRTGALAFMSISGADSARTRVYGKPISACIYTIRKAATKLFRIETTPLEFHGMSYASWRHTVELIRYMQGCGAAICLIRKMNSAKHFAFCKLATLFQR